MLLIFSIPAAVTYMYGRMARDQKQGWVLFAAMALIFFVGVSVAYRSETQGNPLMRGMAVDQGAGNWEGKESRFGIANSALFATVTTATSCGAVNSMHDSFTALGGLVPLANIQLGELVFTSLTKEALPLVRYWTGDISSLDRSPCSCGRTFVRIHVDVPATRPSTSNSFA